MWNIALPLMNVIACYPRKEGQVNPELDCAVQLARQQNMGGVIVTYAMAHRASSLDELFNNNDYQNQQLAKMWLIAIAKKSDVVVHGWGERGGMWLRKRVQGLLDLGQGKSYCTSMSSNPIPHALTISMSMWSGNKPCLVEYPPEGTKVS
jgi:hypothetical protein